MRAGGQITLVAGVLVVGMLVLVGCNSGEPLPTRIPPGSTPGLPATPTVVSSPTPLATQTPPVESRIPTPAGTQTITPTSAVTAQQYLTLTGMQMVTPNQGWATGLGSGEPAGGQAPPTPGVGDVFQTSDGGLTWQNVSPPGVPADSTKAAFFLDALNGWVATTVPVTSATGTVSNTLIVYSTIDGGQSWQRGNTFTLSGGEPADLTFADTLHGWIMVELYTADGSEAVEILKTADGGLIWEPISAAVSGGGQSIASSLPYRCDKNGIAFADAATGWTAGTCSGGTLFLYMTQDGGQTWQPQAPPPPPGDPATLFSNCQCAVDPPLFTSTQNGVLAITISQINQGSYLYITRDGGFTWAVRELPVAQLYGLPDFFDANNGLVTDGQRIFGTADSGQTWTQLGTLPISATNLVGGIDFVDANTGWVTDGQNIYATGDGSQTWATIAPEIVPPPSTAAPPTAVTLADDGKTLTLQVDQEFLLDLSGQYTWTVVIDNPAIVGRVVSETPVKGAQGLYEALRAGSAALTATGEPICRQAQPPCATPSREFHLNIVVP